jgi:hypothetical protein
LAATSAGTLTSTPAAAGAPSTATPDTAGTPATAGPAAVPDPISDTTGLDACAGSRRQGRDLDARQQRGWRASRR